MWKSNLRKGVISLTMLWLLSEGHSPAQEKAVVSGDRIKDGTAGAPSIRFAQPRFEAGAVKEGTVLNLDFEFVNEGAGVLKIKNIIPA